MRCHMFFIDRLVGLFITDEERVAFATPFLPAINGGVACEEVEGQFVRFVVCAATAAFEDYVAQMFIHLNATLELSDLQWNTITGCIPQCPEKNLRILNIAFEQQNA